MTPAGIDTAKLYPILMSSGLPREALGQIWASANRTTPGMLTKEELYTVLALIGVAQVNNEAETNHPQSNMVYMKHHHNLHNLKLGVAVNREKEAAL